MFSHFNGSSLKHGAVHGGRGGAHRFRMRCSSGACQANYSHAAELGTTCDSCLMNLEMPKYSYGSVLKDSELNLSSRTKRRNYYQATRVVGEGHDPMLGWEAFVPDAIAGDGKLFWC